MALSGFHGRVARVALAALAGDGFSLGSGYALQAHGLSERLSDDLDAYQPKFEREPFDRGQALLIAALSKAGMSAEVRQEMDDPPRDMPPNYTAVSQTERYWG